MAYFSQALEHINYLRYNVNTAYSRVKHFLTKEISLNLNPYSLTTMALLAALAFYPQSSIHAQYYVNNNPVADKIDQNINQKKERALTIDEIKGILGNTSIFFPDYNLPKNKSSDNKEQRVIRKIKAYRDELSDLIKAEYDENTYEITGAVLFISYYGRIGVEGHIANLNLTITRYDKLNQHQTDLIFTTMNVDNDNKEGWDNSVEISSVTFSKRKIPPEKRGNKFYKAGTLEHDVMSGSYDAYVSKPHVSTHGEEHNAGISEKANLSVRKAGKAVETAIIGILKKE